MDPRRNKKGAIRKYFILSEKKIKTCQNFWDAIKAILWGRFIALNA